MIQAYDVWKEKKNYGKVSMGVVRTTYLIDENGIIVKAFDKVKAADNPAQMLGELQGTLIRHGVCFCTDGDTGEREKWGKPVSAAERSIA